MSLLLLALFPALMMLLLGMMAAEHRGRFFGLLFVSAVWVGAGILIQVFEKYTFLAAVLCYAQAAVGMAAWMVAVLRGMKGPKAPDPSTSGPPAPSPRASS